MDEREVYNEEIYTENGELEANELLRLYDYSLYFLTRLNLEGYRKVVNSVMLHLLSASAQAEYAFINDIMQKVLHDLSYKMLSLKKDITYEDLQIINLEEKRDVKQYLQEKGDYIGD